jgi:SAM-dependent methyltransferase
MHNIFDDRAEAHSASVPDLPVEFEQLLCSLFRVGRHDRVLDIGCGSGTMALLLSRYSSFVQGIDQSKEMISVARDRDLRGAVEWFEQRVESFVFPQEWYSLIIAFESFHLFPNPDALVRKCASALIDGGIICVGWIKFEWEDRLREAIVNCFRGYGITWDDWGFWTCPDFPAIVNSLGDCLSPTYRAEVSVSSETLTSRIASHLTSISKAASLSSDARSKLEDELERRFQQVLGSKQCKGLSTYSIVYSRRISQGDVSMM